MEHGWNANWQDKQGFSEETLSRCQLFQAPKALGLNSGLRGEMSTTNPFSEVDVKLCRTSTATENLIYYIVSLLWWI